jgi:hypothetical protein
MMQARIELAMPLTTASASDSDDVTASETCSQQLSEAWNAAQYIVLVSFAYMVRFSQQKIPRTRITRGTSPWSGAKCRSEP